METSRLLECLSCDYTDLLSVATSTDLSAQVPSCPDWTVADLVTHVAEVYLHKTEAMRLQDWPDPWPPQGLEDEPPVPLLQRAYRELTAEFAIRKADDPARTWHEPDQTVRFWIRRMAQETVIHRIDGQLAAGSHVTPVPDDLAVDGVDEVLKLFLAYGATSWPQEYAGAASGHPETTSDKESIVVQAGPASWTVALTPRTVTVTDGAEASARALIAGDPEDVLRWLWGRGGEIGVRGDEEWADYLRRLLAALTQ
jgi:uncharacterized protein (TIGR03083 family)